MLAEARANGRDAPSAAERCEAFGRLAIKNPPGGRVSKVL